MSRQQLPHKARVWEAMLPAGVWLAGGHCALMAARFCMRNHEARRVMVPLCLLSPTALSLRFQLMAFLARQMAMSCFQHDLLTVGSVIFRLGAVFVLGAMIGVERQIRQRNAAFVRCFGSGRRQYSVGLPVAS